MNDITKKSYKELCGTLENTFRSDSYIAIAANAKGEAAKKIIMKDDGAIDISEASKTYSEIVKNELIPFLNTISLPKKEMDIIDIQEVSDVEVGHVPRLQSLRSGCVYLILVGWCFHLRMD